MPKINVYLPDDLAEAVREAGLPVSAICQRALEQAVRRVAAIRETVLSDLNDADLAARLPNFTARARTTLTLASRQAETSRASTIDTEHLLGGMLAEGDNLALHVLRALEIEPEQVERALARSLSAGAADPPAEAPATPTPQLSGPAASALELAVTEATGLGHNYIGCEHLLLGLVTEPDGTAGQVLRSLGAEPRLTRRAVAAALAGYVHLRAQTAATGTQTAGAAQPTEQQVQALTAALQQQLQPLVERIEQLEQRVGAAGPR